MKLALHAFRKLFFILISLLPFFTFAQPNFSGVYTIGGTGANYASIKDAVTAIKAGVVTGAVTFRINPGKYKERVTIPFLNGATSANTVTFTSKNDDPQEVIVYDKPMSSANSAIFKLDNASFINIKNISIINNGDVATGVYITNVSAFNTVENCIIRMDSIKGFSVLNAGIYGRISSGGSNDRVNAQSNTIKNCKIFGGSYGVNFEGCCVTFSDLDNKIIGNEINFASAWPIHARYNHNLIIDGNRINTHPNSISAFGISVLNGSVRSLSDNITSRTTQYGFFIQSVSGEGDGLIKNNMIGNGAFKAKSGSSSFPFGGMFFKACNNVNIIHNSVNYDAPDENGRAFHLDNTFGTPATSIGVHILNNSFSNESTGYAYKIESPDLVVRSDFNNLFTRGSILGTWGTVKCDSLKNLQQASGKDVSSISTNPLYFSGNNLHTTNPKLNAKASFQINVTTDIDLENRNTSTPDIGADEFNSLQFNIGISNIGPAILNVGNVNIEGIFRNEGTGSLKDSIVKVSYSLDNGLSWSAPETFVIQGMQNYREEEKYTFTNPAIINTPGTYSVCVRVESPGLKLDTDKKNDKFCKDICTGLKGVYTIGGVSPTYLSIGDAIKDINFCGIAGEVIFNIRTGTYTEQNQIGHVPGCTNLSKIIFQSETGNANDVLLISDGLLNPNYESTWQFYNAKHIELKNLSIENSSKIEGPAIGFTNKSYDIKIENCSIICDTNSLSPVINIENKEVFSNIVEPEIESIVLLKNNIIGGDMGIYVNGDLSAKADGLKILNNSIKQCTSFGIKVQNHSLKEISGNQISTQANNVESIGLAIKNCNTDYLVNANTIYGSGFVGIFIDKANGNENGAVLANNMISWAYNNLNDSVAGMFINSSEKIDIFNNSICFQGAGNSASPLRIDSSLNINLKNNILFNNGAGLVYHIRSSANVNESDYNCLFTNGNTFAYYNGDYRKNFTELKLISGHEKKSLNNNPLFFSLTDLHTNNEILNDKGIPLEEVKFDYDGQPRNSVNPDIGADEFSLGIDGAISEFISPDSTKVFHLQARKVKVKIFNLGTTTIKNFPLEYKVNGIKKADGIFVDSIVAGANAEFEFSQEWMPSDLGNNVLCAKLTVPGDIENPNDELCKDILVEDPIGIENIDLKNNFLGVYPNPFSENLNVEINLLKKSDLRIYLYNILGKKEIDLELLNQNIGKNTVNISNTLLPGTYLLKVMAGEKVEFKRVIKIKN